ncbi:MAG: RagB/SusD family nutrient uptake outer membrane protein [Chitinophagaceae bacterium]|nr:RagB/SusD family nutrient uptake outer membrane protein [Chitinophagaceae bacterium]
MKIFSKNILPALVLVVLAVSCKKLDLVPADRFTEANYWTTQERAETVLNTAYSNMFNSNHFFYNEALSDNAYNGRGDNEGVMSISAGLADASLGRFSGEWNAHYACIKTTHIFLENIHRVTAIKEDVRNRMIAEARFIRAYQYFQLYTWYGDVPLFDKDISVQESQTIGRTARAEVVNFVLNELTDVEGMLPANNEYEAADRGRITKGAAAALRARALLYEGRWAEAGAITQKFLNGDFGVYGLLNTYEEVFLPQNEYSKEVIFDHGYVPELRTYSNFFDMAPLAAGARLNALAPTQELADDYIMLNGKGINETGSGYDEETPYAGRDPRFTHTIVYHGSQWKLPNGSTRTIYTKPGTDPDDSRVDEYAPGSVSSPTGYYFRKYYDPTSVGNFNSGLNLILIRYADILLMHAEALNEDDKLTADIWNQTIRALRERAGFTDAAALQFNNSLNKDQLRNIIRRERRSELAMEGLRIFDIRRWRIAETVLNGWIHGARFGDPTIDNGYIRVNQRSFDPNKHYVWPIPRDERNRNPNLTQNNGW